MKTLIVYYSRTGNIRTVTQKTASITKADIEEIVDKKKRTGLIGYLRSGFDAYRQKETKIAETTKNPQDYDLIIIGTSVWAGRITPATRTHIQKSNLSGKKVAFCLTMGGDKPEGPIAAMKALTPNSTHISELALNAKTLEDNEETEKRITEWCKQLSEHAPNRSNIHIF